MAANEFVAVNWNPGQLIEEDILDQMNNNITYLRDQMVDGLYQQRLGGTTSTGLKLLCGTASVPPQKGSGVDVTITFAKMFTANSYPVITTGIVSDGNRHLTVTQKGIGRVLPNNQGFVARVQAFNPGKNPILGRTFYIQWLAMGY